MGRTKAPQRKSRSGSRGRSRTRSRGKDAERPKLRRLAKTSKLPIPPPPDGRKIVPWPKWIRVQFENVPLASIESCWYGPWATLLSELFPSSFQKHNGEIGHFQLAPQHLRLNDPARPEYTLFYVILTGNLPVCVVEIKPYYHLDLPYLRVDALNQVINRLESLYHEDWRKIRHMATVFGIQCIGTRFMIVEMDVRTGLITKPVRPASQIAEPWRKAPLAWWKADVMSVEGAYHLLNLASHIRRMLEHLPTIPDEADITLAELLETNKLDDSAKELIPPVYDGPDYELYSSDDEDEDDEGEANA